MIIRYSCCFERKVLETTKNFLRIVSVNQSKKSCLGLLEPRVLESEELDLGERRLESQDASEVCAKVWAGGGTEELRTRGLEEGGQGESC